MDKPPKVSFKKHLVRNTAINNKGKAIVVRNSKATKPSMKDLEKGDAPEQYKETASKNKIEGREIVLDEPSKSSKQTIPNLDGSMKSLTICSKSTSKSSKVKDLKKSFNANTNLDVPKIQSSMNIGKKIDNLTAMKPTKPSLKISNKRPFDEKLTRQVNFPHEKNIFKDLMPLSSPNRQKYNVLPLREPMPPKDREPVLEDFVHINVIQEFSYIPNIKLETRKAKMHCNNLHLYKMLQLLEV